MTKKILFILMPDGFQDLEFNVPYTMLKQKGYHVDVAGLQPGEATGKNIKHTPNLQLADLTSKNFDTYDALVIPGGPGSTTHLWENEEIEDVVLYFHDKKKIVATICYACIVPAEAGILTGKVATVYPTDEAKAIFTENNIIFSNEGVVSLPEERIITGQGPTFAQPFAQAIVDMLEK